MSVERRRYVRYASGDLVFCSLDGMKFDGRVMDIGPGGALVETSTQIRKGARIVVRVSAATPRMRPIHLIGKVVRVLTSPAALGLQWSRVVSSGAVDTVVDFLAAVLHIPPGDELVRFRETKKGVVGMFQHQLIPVEEPVPEPPVAAVAREPVAVADGLPAMLVAGRTRARVLLVGATAEHLVLLSDMAPVHRKATLTVVLLPGTEAVPVQLIDISPGIGDYMAQLDLAVSADADPAILQAWAQRFRAAA